MNDVQADTVQAKKNGRRSLCRFAVYRAAYQIHTNSHIKEVQQMILYKRFLLIITVIACTAGALCGVMTAKINTERRLYGEQKTLPAQEEPMTDADHSGDAQSQPDQPASPKTNNAAQRTISLREAQFNWFITDNCGIRRSSVRTLFPAAVARHLSAAVC